MASLVASHPVFDQFLSDKIPGGNIAENLFASLSSTSDSFQALLNDNKDFFNHLHVYTDEEEADNASVAVLWKIGQNPTALENFFTFQMTPDQFTECNRYLQRGSEPPYGSLGDPHHGSCFRTYNLEKYKNYLETNCSAWIPSCVRDFVP